MKFSTRTRYGLMFLTRLGAAPATQPVQLSDVAQKEGISVKYLEKIVRRLKQQDLIRSQQGAHGGYFLKTPAEHISLRDIFQLLEGDLAPVDCLQSSNCCQKQDRCSTLFIWNGLQNSIENFLSTLTLKDAIQEFNKINTPKGACHEAL